MQRVTGFRSGPPKREPGPTDSKKITGPYTGGSMRAELRKRCVLLVDAWHLFKMRRGQNLARALPPQRFSRCPAHRRKHVSRYLIRHGVCGWKLSTAGVRHPSSRQVQPSARWRRRHTSSNCDHPGDSFVPTYRHCVRLGPTTRTESRRGSSGGANDRRDCGIYCGTTDALRDSSSPCRAGRFTAPAAGLVSTDEGCSVLRTGIRGPEGTAAGSRWRSDLLGA